MLSQELRKIARQVKRYTANGIVTDITDYSGQVDPLAGTALFGVDNVIDVMKKIKDGVKASYVSMQPSQIGGPAKMAIMLTVSLDSREMWANGIMENSRYGKFSIERNGEVEQFSGRSPVKFRKTTCRSIDDIIRKLNQWVERNG